MKPSRYSITLVLLIVALIVLSSRIDKLKQELAAQKASIDTSDYAIEMILADKELLRKAKHIVIYGEDNNPVVIK